MLSFLVRRLFHTVLVIWGALTLIYILLQLMPGDVIETMLGADRAVDPVVRRNLERYYGLDDSAFMQYVTYLKRFVTFDLGRSYATDREVFVMLKEAAVTSGRLTFWAVLFYSVLGIVSGVLAAVKRYSWFDSLTAVGSVALAAVPAFVMGLLLQYLTGVLPYRWNWPEWARMPVTWETSKLDWFFVFPLGDGWKQLVLPVVTLACVNLGITTRTMRTSMLEVLRADYMRTAAAKGLKKRVVIFKHGLRNALIPVITSVGVDVTAIFGVAVLTETVFNIPGMGGTIAQAVGLQDAPVVLGFSAVVVTITAIVSLIVDLSYGWLDPRIRVTDRGE